LYDLPKNIPISPSITNLTVYRGHWCPFCQAYLKTLETLLPSITAAGGKVMAITAQVEQHLEEMRTLTGYTGTLISDPTNSIATTLKARGKVDVAISEKKGYEHGMAQPAILVIQQDKTVLFEWAIVPALMNMGGAKDRPDLVQVWENVEAKMEGKPQVHSKYDLQSFGKVIWGKIFG
jgi:peroxiredoxin